ncbi:S1/P1 nuclease [Algoriphagus sp. H41]|uniref:S1/P1 nuclease n=1 Tax=Algoriphagus oliviformis TaxID=2811231 RepID=A0ABS3C0U2_9BACT|nr:S1/P1 nuclease [Algoriphagus oliviformis]MBN7809800.1 S1/P1 nuclease [Algoriphagus oliviformis]
MKKTVTLALALVLGLSFSQSVFAWGQLGHYVVGYMAQKQLKRSTLKRVNQVLGPMSLGRSGTWMDEIKSDRAYDHLYSWHYLTSEHGEYNAAIQEKGGNAYEAINQLKAELKEGNMSAEEESKKLKMLIHIVEDVHQPLHVGTGTDKGGNEVRVEYFGRNSNLHSVWDTEMIEGWNMSYTEIGDELSRRLTPAMIAAYQDATIDDWLKEAVDLRTLVYKLPENKKLSYNYGYDTRDAVEERLLAASVRLAQILEEIY